MDGEGDETDEPKTPGERKLWWDDVDASVEMLFWMSSESFELSSWRRLLSDGGCSWLFVVVGDDWADEGNDDDNGTAAVSFIELRLGPSSSAVVVDDEDGSSVNTVVVVVALLFIWMFGSSVLLVLFTVSSSTDSKMPLSSIIFISFYANKIEYLRLFQF